MQRTSMRRAFTLIELLVVVAIVAILAALLFPVFAQAKAAAKQTTALSNSRNMAMGYLMYLSDNEDRFPVLTYGNDPAYSLDNPNRFAHQLVMPYVRAENVMVDPMDPASERERETWGGDGIDPATSGWPKEQRALNLAYASDTGLNYQFLSPVYWPAEGYQPMPASFGQITSPAGTVLATGGVWGRRADGTPYGGGSGIVDPPCVLDADGRDTRPLPGSESYWLGGWNPSTPLAGNVFGYVWPWHGTRTIVAFVDGHAKAMTISGLAVGCDVQDSMSGAITDPVAYLWDLK